MNITSNLLGELGASIKLSQIAPQETTLDVKASIQPIMNLRTTARQFIQLSNLNLALINSFVGSWQNTVANAAALVQAMFNLSAGVWDINLTSNYSANYPVTVNNGGIVIMDDGTQITNLFEGVCAVTLGGMISANRHIILQTDRILNFTAKLGVNGATQIHNMALSLVVTRLL
jgi:hypothetical protein